VRFSTSCLCSSTETPWSPHQYSNCFEDGFRFSEHSNGQKAPQSRRVIEMDFYVNLNKKINLFLVGSEKALITGTGIQHLKGLKVVWMDRSRLEDGPKNIHHFVFSLFNILLK
jgi:hypothetical protein